MTLLLLSGFSGVWGDQWQCPCGTNNVLQRTVCRECGAPKPPDETIRIVPYQQMINDVFKMSDEEKERNELGKHPNAELN